MRKNRIDSCVLEGQPYRVRSMYCTLDDHSNQSLVTSHFIDAFGDSGPETEYVLATCAGKSVSSRRLLSGYVVQSLDGSYTRTLPSLLECNEMPNK